MLHPTKVAPPSTDKRWRLVEAAMRRNGNESHALIEALHAVQEAFGCLSDEALNFVAAALQVPLSKVYGVATFYNYFTLKPQGDHLCVVCLGTACYIKGANQIMQAIEKAAEIKAGETTEDHKVSLIAARCLGACGLAPAVVFDGEVGGKLGAEDAVKRVKEWMQNAGG